MVFQEALNLAEPARKVAKKIPDARLSFLSACLLKELGKSSEVRMSPENSFLILYRNVQKKLTRITQNDESQKTNKRIHSFIMI